MGRDKSDGLSTISGSVTRGSHHKKWSLQSPLSCHAAKADGGVIPSHCHLLCFNLHHQAMPSQQPANHRACSGAIISGRAPNTWKTQRIIIILSSPNSLDFCFISPTERTNQPAIHPWPLCKRLRRRRIVGRQAAPQLLLLPLWSCFHRRRNICGSRGE